jgi:hypothetical protein
MAVRARNHCGFPEGAQEVNAQALVLGVVSAVLKSSLPQWDWVRRHRAGHLKISRAGDGEGRSVLTILVPVRPELAAVGGYVF